MVVRNETNGCILAGEAHVADTSAKRRRGLLGRDALPKGHALWIVPCSAVHTWGMRFSIDLIYISRRHKVRKVRSAVAPWKFSMCLFAHSVLELPAGTIAQTHTKAGDQLNLQFDSEPAG